jgi:hypothetical protein
VRRVGSRVGAIALLVAGLAALSSSSSFAVVLAAPTAITGPVSAVSATSATAHGTVNPNGLATTWYFEFGTSTSYGRRTATRSAGSASGNVLVSAALTGLTAGTTYHYRLVATSSDGTARGADGVFTTLTEPVAVTGAATGITVNAANLNGTVDPNGRATTWHFEYGPTTSFGSKTAARSAGSGASAVSVSASLSGLATGRLYHFRLVATSDAGTSRGARRIFSTAGPPAAVTAQASSLAPTSARLNGRLTPNGLATSWYFEYGTSTRYGSRTATRNAGKGTRLVNVRFGLSRLRPGTTYHYRLVASNAAGTTRGADVAFTTTSVTLATRAQTVVFGRAVMLSGVIPSGRAGEVVTLVADPYGSPSRSVANVVTGAAGTWSYLARPAIRTVYRANWRGTASPGTVIAVRPRVRFRRIGAARFTVRVLGRRSFRGRWVRFQRRTSAGRWVLVRRVRLKRRSGATFRTRLPRGRVRIVMSVNQAGPGYLAGISRTIAYRR